MVLFRNKSHAVEANVQLPLLPAGNYSLRSVITGKKHGPFTAEDWARGISIKFPEAEPVEILEITSTRS